MDKTDHTLIAALRRNARASLSELASILGVTRATVRARMERLTADGTITGYTVSLNTDLPDMPVRGIMLLGIEGRGTDRLIHALTGLPSVVAVHSTNGKWDLIIELATDTLETLDGILSDIRRLNGVTTSETNLVLKTRTPGI